MKITINLDSKKLIVLSALLIFLLISIVTFGARRTQEPQKVVQPSVAMQFGQSFVCIISQCGWPAIVFLILPAVAVFIWKKVFSVG